MRCVTVLIENLEALAEVSLDERELEGVMDRLEEMAAALLDGSVTSELLPAEPNALRDWEGLLFPDTYEVNEDVSALEIIQKMTDQFSQVTGELAYGAADNQLGYSAYEVLIVASLIEAEVKIDEEVFSVRTR